MMSARKIRRAAAHAARKAARKAGFPVTPSPSVAPAASLPDGAELAVNLAQPIATAVLESIPETPGPEPGRTPLSAARLAANKANAKLSQGPLTAATKAISAQNHTSHGLARHQDGNFKLLTSENAADFQALQKALIDEHQPAGETEAILVNRMAESHWLENRAQRLQDTCLDLDTGAVTDEKKFSLYMRYKTTHTRAFHKCLNDLLKLRSEKRKAELGVEAQRIKSEAHELKKQAHSWQVKRKEAAARRRDPELFAKYAAELAKKGAEPNVSCGATQAA